MAKIKHARKIQPFALLESYRSFAKGQLDAGAIRHGDAGFSALRKAGKALVVFDFCAFPHSR